MNHPPPPKKTAEVANPVQCRPNLGVNLSCMVEWSRGNEFTMFHRSPTALKTPFVPQHCPDSLGMFDLTPKMGFARETQLTHYPATLHNYKATRPCEASLPPDLGVKQAKGLSFTAGRQHSPVGRTWTGHRAHIQKTCTKKTTKTEPRKSFKNHDTSSPVADCYLRQFARPSYLRWQGRVTAQSQSNLRHVADDCFDSIASSFNLGHHAGHLVAISGVCT
jgi:hypothetical protein